jgi:hypothetical protein
MRASCSRDGVMMTISGEFNSPPAMRERVAAAVSAALARARKRDESQLSEHRCGLCQGRLP